MKRLLRFALILTAACSLCLAAEGKEAEGEGGLQNWKWANFLVLAIGLGYLIGKNGGPFFNARSQSISKDIEESRAIFKSAEEKAADVDRRLANLQTEIAALREDSQREAKAESERLAAHTIAEIAKIRDHAEREIVSATKAARMDLRRFAAELAVDLAETKIRARMNPATQDGLVRGFVRDLK